MKTRITLTVLAAAVLIAAVPVRAHAQDSLTTRVKGLYESADYEEALQLLETLKGRTSNSEAAAYRVFCLVALGRKDEAKAAVESIVREDPLYRPTDVAPRLKSFFEDTRKPLLPAIARTSYASAKAAFDGKSWTQAVAEFDRVISLLGEIGSSDAGAADLRTLASGFRDLAKSNAEPPPAPKPEPTPTPTPTPPAAPVKPAEPEVYGAEHVAVKKPVAMNKTMPTWVPENPTEERSSFVGAIELIVNETGKVVSAKMIDSVHPRYDKELLKAALNWTFRPATKDGTPVKYRYTMAVQLGK